MLDKKSFLFIKIKLLMCSLNERNEFHELNTYTINIKSICIIISEIPLFLNNSKNTAIPKRSLNSKHHVFHLDGILPERNNVSIINRRREGSVSENNLIFQNFQLPSFSKKETRNCTYRTIAFKTKSNNRKHWLF